VPDVFAGHPLLVTGRYAAPGTATVRVKGRIGGEDVVLPVAVALPAAEPRNTVLRTLWARRAIDGLVRRMLNGEQEPLVRGVIDLSVRFRVLSRYTAFVAIEEKVRTNERGDPVKVEVPVELPDGVSWEGVFGEGEDGDEAGGVAGNVVSGKAGALMQVRGHGSAAGLVGPGGGGAGFGRAAVATPSAAAPPPSPKPARATGGSGVTAYHSAPMMLRSAGAAEEPAADRRDDHERVEARLSVRMTVESAEVGGTAASVEVARAVDQAVAAVLPAVKRCLAFGKAAGQSLPGALVVALTIDAAGRVTAATPSTSRGGSGRRGRP